MAAYPVTASSQPDKTALNTEITSRLCAPVEAADAISQVRQLDYNNSTKS